MRLVTRGDADGLCCAIFLKLKEQIDSIEFVHPKDMQDGKVTITKNDIIANLPYHPDCGMWFDHHATSEENAKTKEFQGHFRLAPSCARVIFEYYKDPQLGKFDKLLEETDRIDSANLSVEDVTNPQGYMLVFYTLDPRSGLGPFKDYFLKLMDWLTTKNVMEILMIPEVRERCKRLLMDQQKFIEAMKATSRLDGNVIITDLRSAGPVPSGNRFLIFTLFPLGNVQARIFNGRAGEFIVVALGKSIFNRTCEIDLGALCGEFGGGGHSGAATCQLPLDQAEEAVQKIITRLKN
jgi:hypothetical protein